MANSWNRGIALVKSIRDYQKYKAQRGPIAKVLRQYSRFRHLIWTLLTASDIDPNAKIGQGIKLPHPSGVVIHGRTVIGDDCMIMQQVTLGQRNDDKAPVIGSEVYVGAGAKVLGGITIGNRARIGANAVVLCDVPADWTAVGIPARLYAPKRDRSSQGAKAGIPDEKNYD